MARTEKTYGPTPLRIILPGRAAGRGQLYYSAPTAAPICLPGCFLISTQKHCLHLPAGIPVPALENSDRDQTATPPPSRVNVAGLRKRSGDHSLPGPLSWGHQLACSGLAGDKVDWTGVGRLSGSGRARGLGALASGREIQPMVRNDAE